MKINFIKNILTPKIFTEIDISTYFKYIKDEEFKTEILNYRNTFSLAKDEQQAMKNKIPAVTISGTFKNSVANANLLVHSGFICLDFDKLDNVNEVKEILKSDKYTYAVLISASGNGLASIVKIDGAKHQESFDGLKAYYFKNYNLLIDKSCRNVSRLRFLSMDKDIVVNEKSKVFKEYIKETKAKPMVNTILTGREFDALIQKIVSGGYNLTGGSYDNFLTIGFALSNEFQEGGRNYFHAISSQDAKYNQEQCDKQYTYCMRDSGGGSKKIKIGSLYYLAKQAGIELKSNEGKKLEQIAKLAKKGGRNKESVKEIAKTAGLNEVDADEIANAVFDNNVSLKLNEESNLSICQTFLSSNYNLHYNIITNEVEDRNVIVNGKYKTLDDMVLNTMFLKLSDITENKINYEFFCKVIFSEFTKYYNPFLEFFEKNINYPRSTDLISELADTITTGTLHYEKFIKHWGCGVIASIYGKTSPLVLVLAGEKQNTGKTEWFRRLLPRELNKYYTESKLDAGKDDDILMCKKLIIMDDEFGGKSKHESKKFKELTSKQSFSIRLPYGRTHKEMNRLAALCGTTNDLNLISDSTGNRRIIPVNVISIDHKKYNDIDKTALFMAFYDLYHSGFAWQLSNEDIKTLNDSTNEFQSTNFEAELISAYFEIPENTLLGEHLTNTEIKTYLEMVSKQKIFDTRKLGLELKLLGFEQELKKINGRVSRYYFVKKRNSLQSNLLKNDENQPF